MADWGICDSCDTNIEGLSIVDIIEIIAGAIPLNEDQCVRLEEIIKASREYSTWNDG